MSDLDIYSMYGDNNNNKDRSSTTIITTTTTTAVEQLEGQLDSELDGLDSELDEMDRQLREEEARIRAEWDRRQPHPHTTANTTIATTTTTANIAIPATGMIIQEEEDYMDENDDGGGEEARNHGNGSMTTTTTTKSSLSSSSSNVSGTTATTVAMAAAMAAAAAGGNEAVANVRRVDVLREIVVSEARYVTDLETLIHLFYQPLRLTPRALLLRRSASMRDTAAKADQRLLSTEDTERIFSNVDTLLSFHQELLRSLQSRCAPLLEPTTAAADADPAVGDIFANRAPFLKMYVTYLNNYQDALQTLSRCQRQNPGFREYLAKVHRDPALHDLNLVAYLLLPVQRIPRYRMLLESLAQRTPESHPDFASLQQALRSIVEVADQVNESIRSAENAQKVVEVQNLLGTTLETTLITPSRRHIFTGELFKISRHAIQKRICFLFNDILVYARELNFFRITGAPVASVDSFQYKGTIQLDTAWIRDLSHIKLVEHGFFLVCPHKTYTFNAVNKEQKDMWLSRINAAIDAIVAKSPDLVNKRGEIKLPPVTGIYKHFTIPMDQLYQTEELGEDGTAAGMTGPATAIGTTATGPSNTPPPIKRSESVDSVGEGDTLIRKLSRWRTKSFQRPKDLEQQQQQSSSGSPPFSHGRTHSNARSPEVRHSKVSDMFVGLPKPAMPTAELTQLLSTLPENEGDANKGGAAATQPAKPSANKIPYRSRPLPPLPQKKKGGAAGDGVAVNEEIPAAPNVIKRSASIDSNEEPPSKSFLVRAIWDNVPDDGDELAFKKGDVITVVNSKDAEWWQGKLNGKTGWLPACYVQNIGERESVVALHDKIGEALWDYNARQPEELTFSRGELIRILWDRDPFWCQGERLGGGQIGWFPSNFVVVSDDDEDSD